MNAKRQPKWKRAGYQNEPEYRAACAATKKTENAAMLATKLTQSGYVRVLQVMWRAADFDKPRVTITKQQIMAKAPCSLSTVKRALKALRDEGSVIPLKNWEGGSGIATTWRLCIAGHASTPADEHIELMEAKRKRDAAWRFLKDKYGPAKALEIMGDPEEEEKVPEE